jgi:hypothetical protein
MAGAGTAERTGPRAGLDRAALAEAALTDAARAATGRPDVAVTRWWTEPVAYPIGSWATAELTRVRGVATDGAGSVPWSAFVKVLRSPHGLRLPDGLPPGPRARMQAMAAADRTWRHEADVYRADLDDVLPPGMRLPARYRIDERDGDRIVEWLEDVPVADARWDGARFARAARLLGRLGVRLGGCGRLPDSLIRVPGAVLRLQFLERELFTLSRLADGATWAHPLVARVADPTLRADLHRLVDRVPAILDAAGVRYFDLDSRTPIDRWASTVEKAYDYSRTTHRPVMLLINLMEG